MVAIGSFEKAKNYINAHTKKSEEDTRLITGPCITISRETGAGAETVSKIITDIFSEYSDDNSNPWIIFDQNLIEKVLQDHHLPMRLSEIMEEKKYSAIRSILNELIGGQPGSWTLVHKTTETILQLAHMGFCIIVERGGNIITSKMDNCLHVRLVAAMEDKIRHIQELFNYSRKEAVEYIKNEDENRREYIKTYFHKSVDDPLLYHMVLNTSDLSYNETAGLICNTLMSRMPEYFRMKSEKAIN